MTEKEKDLQRRVSLAAAAENRSPHEIAARYGIPSSVVRVLWGPPTCPECGDEMSGRGVLCASCSTKSRRMWSKDEMLIARDTWIRAHGKPPTSYDWSPAGAARQPHSPNRGSRWESGEYPAYTTVHREFGGWPQFLAADPPSGASGAASD